MDKNEILLRLENGEKQKVISEVYKSTVKKVYGFVYSRTGNREWSEEIVSDTYITFIELIEKYDGSSKIETFIIGIAINKMRQHWTKVKKMNRVEFDEEFYILPEDTSTGSVLDREESGKKHELLMKSLDTVLKQLPEKYRKVLRFRFIENMNIKSVAQKMNLTEANIKVIQHRALKKASEIASNLLTEKNEKTI